MPAAPCSWSYLYLVQLLSLPDGRGVCRTGCCDDIPRLQGERTGALRVLYLVEVRSDEAAGLA